MGDIVGRTLGSPDTKQGPDIVRYKLSNPEFLTSTSPGSTVGSGIKKKRSDENEEDNEEEGSTTLSQTTTSFTTLVESTSMSSTTSTFSTTSTSYTTSTEMTSTSATSVSLASEGNSINAAAIAVPVVLLTVLSIVAVIFMCLYYKKRKSSVHNPTYTDTSPVILGSVTPIIDKDQIVHHVYADADNVNRTHQGHNERGISQISTASKDSVDGDQNTYFVLEPLDTSRPRSKVTSRQSKDDTKSKSTKTNSDIEPSNDYFVLEKMTPPNSTEGKGSIVQSESRDGATGAGTEESHIYDHTFADQSIENNSSNEYQKLDRRFVVKDDPKLSHYD